MDGLRAPARIGVLVVLSLSVLAAIGAARLLASLGSRTRAVAVLVIGAVIVAEGWAAPLEFAAFDAHGRPGDRAAYRWLAQQPPGGVIELTVIDWGIAPPLTYQYATSLHGHPVVKGYSGYGSPLQESLAGAASALNDFDRMEDALGVLRTAGMRYVVVHPRDYADLAVGLDTVKAIYVRPALAAETFRSDAADRVPLLFDGDGDTRWLTGRPQRGDEWIRIVFDRPRDVSRIELATASRSFGDYPRDLRVEAISEGGASSVLFQGPMIVPYGRALAKGGLAPAIVVGLPPNRTQTLMIRQTGQSHRWFWSVHELGLWVR